MQQEQPQYYRAVPVSKKPKKSGYYLTPLGKIYYSSRKEAFMVRKPTHYLEPIPIPDAVVLRSALEKLLKATTGGNEYLPHVLKEAIAAAREALSAGDGWVRVDSGVLPRANTRCWLGWETGPAVWEGYYDGHLFVDIEGFEIKNKPTHYSVIKIPSPPLNK